MIFFIKKSLIVLLVFGLNLEAAESSISPLGDSDTLSVSSHDLQFFLDDAVVSPLLIDKDVRQGLRKKLILNDQCLVCKKNLAKYCLYNIVVHYGLVNLAKPASHLKKKHKRHVPVLNTLQRDDFYAAPLAEYINRYKQESAAKSVKHNPGSSNSRTSGNDFVAELVDIDTKKCLLCPHVFPSFTKSYICRHYGMERLVSQCDSPAELRQSHIAVLKKLQDGGQYSDVFKTQRESVLEKQLRCSTKRAILRSHKLSKDDAAQARRSKRLCTNSEADTTA